MTKQEIFNKAARHLLTQNARSGTEGGCLYKGPNGLRCAVGCLFPEHYDTSSFEGMAAGSEELRPHLIVCGILPENDPDSSLATLCLLDRLQRIHDSFAPANWRQELTEAADDYGFQMIDV